jgi:hypothetical protein
MTFFINQKTVKRAAVLSTRKLASLIRPNGLFTYRYYVGRNEALPIAYNVLRHFGSCWALLDSAKETDAPPEVTEAAGSALVAGLAKFTQPLGDDGVLCVVDGEKIKLGGAGLALLAIESHPTLARDPEVIRMAEAIGHYILRQRKPDGDFVHARFLANSEDTGFVSHYYTGEALLGLFCLSNISGDRRWSEAALESLVQLTARNYGVAERSHWMLYSIERAILFREDERWHELATKIASRILAIPYSEWRSTSSWLACYCEGLATWLRLTKEKSFSASDKVIRDSCVHTLRRMLRKLMALQTVDGGFVRDPKSPIVRIDYIQHAISALIGFSRGFDLGNVGSK